MGGVLCVGGGVFKGGRERGNGVRVLQGFMLGEMLALGSRFTSTRAAWDFQPGLLPILEHWGGGSGDTLRWV